MAITFYLDDVDEEDNSFQEPTTTSDDEEDHALPFKVGKSEPQTQKRNTQKGRKRSYVNKSGQKGSKRNKKKTQAGKKSTEMPDKNKLVVSIDFGTTHSGASYRSNIESATNQIHPIMDWPGDTASGQYLMKMPSRIAYAGENSEWGPDKKELSRDVIGYEVLPGMRSYSWFKLLLDAQADPTKFDDQHLQSAVGKGTLKLPAKKSAVEVTADYLRIFLRMVHEKLAKSITQGILASTPIHYWITVPAIWNDIAQNNTDVALQKAGFHDRLSCRDEVHFVTEPEAAAVAALKQFQELNTNLLKKGMRMIVCDVGGGTVDLESLKLIEVSKLSLRAIGVGTGGKCGSTTIDRNFAAFMHERFETSFSSIPEVKRVAGSKFANEFERQKKAFAGDPQERFRIAFPALAHELRLRGQTSESFDEEEGEVVFHGSDMAKFFADTIDKACKLIEGEANKILEVEKRSVDTVVLAGGMAASDYVLDRIRTFCHTSLGQDVEIIRPENAWGAIAHGAVQCGLDRTTILSRQSRRHYFIAASRAFCDGIDPEERAVMDPRHGKRIVELQLLLKKNQTVKENQRHYCKGFIELPNMRDVHVDWPIICSNADTAPQWSDDPGCFTIGHMLLDLTPVLQTFVKKGFNDLTYDATDQPVRMKTNIVTCGGHGAGIVSIAANVKRRRVGELVLDVSV